MSACPGGCSTVGELIGRASFLLNDPEHVRWPTANLISFLNEGLCRIAARRPDAFSETRMLTLAPGKLQRVPADVMSFGSIETSVDKDGNTTPVSEVDQRFAKIFAKRPCSSRDARCENPRSAAAAKDPCSSYVVKSFSKNSLDERVFTVDPPVPAGCAPTVQATIIKKPQAFCGNDGETCIGMDCEYEGPLLDWVLHRALSLDHESAVAAKMSMERLSAFNLALAADYLMEQRFGSGFYRGAEGQGDGGFKQR